MYILGQMYNFEKYVTEMEQGSVCIDLDLNQVLGKQTLR